MVLKDAEVGMAQNGQGSTQKIWAIYFLTYKGVKHRGHSKGESGGGHELPVLHWSHIVLTYEMHAYITQEVKNNM